MLGQLTSPSGFDLAEALTCQERVVRVRFTPLSPTATQMAVLGQLTPKRLCEVPELSAFQLVPLLVANTVPRGPTTTQEVTLGQLTASSDWAAPEKLVV